MNEQLFEYATDRLVRDYDPSNIDGWSFAFLDWSAGNTQREFVEWSVEGNREYPAASLAKLAIAHSIDLAGFNDWEIPDRVIDDRPAGTGILRHAPQGYEVSRELQSYLMLAESDNVAAKMVVDWLGGAHQVNELLGSSPLGLVATRLEPTDEGSFYYGETTAVESARLMYEVLKNKRFSRALHRSHAWYGLRGDIDLHPTWAGFNPFEAILRKIGQVPFDYILQQAQKRQPSRFASKEGALDDQEDKIYVRHDVADIEGIVVAALSRHDKAGPYNRRHVARKVQREVGKLVFKHQENQRRKNVRDNRT